MTMPSIESFREYSKVGVSKFVYCPKCHPNMKQTKLFAVHCINHQEINKNYQGKLAENLVSDNIRISRNKDKIKRLFIHTKTCKEFVGTRYEFADFLGIEVSNIHALINGHRKTCRNYKHMGITK